MKNQYPGTCYRCGKNVPAKEGHFERHIGEWRTQHTSCAIKYRGTDVHYIQNPSSYTPLKSPLRGSTNET